MPSLLYHFNLFSYIGFIGWRKSGSITVSVTTVTRSPSMTTLSTGYSLAGARTRLIHIHLLTKEFPAIEVLNRRLGPRRNSILFRKSPELETSLPVAGRGKQACPGPGGI
ncbi:MAG: hypothetical protein A2V86_17955 [Deltaproteobacteria bacterium RBG_16_49_23]|nr:MAG: hypothetical protein A2V86_17955 [Deltaproteobacteria bacterium RBG_16_49_23]